MSNMMYKGHMFFYFHHICYLVRMLRLCLPSNVDGHILSKLLVRLVYDRALEGCFTVKDIYRAGESFSFLLPVQGQPGAVKLIYGFNEHISHKCDISGKTG